MKSITAQDLYNFTKCAHRVYLDAHGDLSQKGTVNTFIRLLWELGLQTEREYLASLEDQEVADLQPLSLNVAFDETIRLMEQGVAVIYQGCLQDDSYVGRPDLLVKCEEASSRFGDYCYEPIEIKAGKGWEQTEGRKPRFKEHYAFQVLFYRMLLKSHQGTLPTLARIINGQKEFEVFDPAPFESDFSLALEQVRRLVNADDTSEPVLGSQCYLCGWFNRCEQWVRERSDPTSLFFVGKQKFLMKTVGLHTVEDIARMEIGDYLKPPKKIPRMGERSLARMKQRAQVLLRHEPRIQPGYAFPDRAREIYFDIEDDPTQSLTYLYGLLIREGKNPPSYQYFLAREPQEEEQTVRAFWDFLASVDEGTYYVYSHKERTSLKQLMERYGLDRAVFDRYVEREYDLYSDLIVIYSDWPTFSYSIKHIAKMVGFRWRDPDPSGANSIAWFNDYLKNPSQQALLERILRYNEDDCAAMMAIKDYFAQQHPVMKETVNE
ncbi:MAG: TM0106 family RecB-like putative nuclease [Nitrospirales bacterium]|nr:TM0106 family RecB-like putative nuclease [Nitrospira sp.]MDR4500043.1 TM0106 family RecB-like putative nuclease [Nitrospirales bacterium]